MNCPKCGTENEADAIYCEECGAVMNATESQDNMAAVSDLPLEPGHIAANNLKIVSVISYDGTCGLYEACSMEESGSEVRKLIIEHKNIPLHGEPLAEGKSKSPWEILNDINSAGIWHPETKGEERGNLISIGPWPGQPLREYAAEPLKPEEARKISLSILDSLELIHNAGLLCKSLSPDSVWIGEDGAPLLVRFDKTQPLNEACAQYSVVEGFSSPEAHGMISDTCDARSDLYSLGALMYWMLSGKTVDVFARGIAVPCEDAALNKAVLKALKREPGERWQTVEEMKKAVETETLPEDEAASHTANKTVPLTSDASAANDAAALAQSGVQDGAPSAQSDASPSGASAQSSGAAAVNSAETADDPAKKPSGKYTVAVQTNVGAVRKINQDAFVNFEFSMCERDVPTRARLIAVIDGMGGEAEGDKAASLAARAMVHEMADRFAYIGEGTSTSLLLPDNPEERRACIIELAMKRANETIFRYASLDSKRRGMGCTMTCVLLEGDKATFGHVGDTRGYVFRNGVMDQVTEDHSIVGQLVRMGAMTREEARNSPRRSVIFRALGTELGIEIDIRHRTLQKGDYIFMSSDGVWEYYTDEEMLAFFSNNPVPEELCAKMIQTTLSRGADDNTTAAVIRVD